MKTSGICKIISQAGKNATCFHDVPWSAIRHYCSHVLGSVWGKQNCWAIVEGSPESLVLRTGFQLQLDRGSDPACRADRNTEAGLRLEDAGTQ